MIETTISVARRSWAGAEVIVSAVGRPSIVQSRPDPGSNRPTRWTGSVRRLQGGLGIATVAANAVFAAVTGSSIASASVFTRVSVPEMRRFGYTGRFTVGVVAGSSVLGMLIPPSVMLILYAIIAEQSVGDMFIALGCGGLVASSSRFATARGTAWILAVAWVLGFFIDDDFGPAGGDLVQARRSSLPFRRLQSDSWNKVRNLHPRASSRSNSATIASSMVMPCPFIACWISVSTSPVSST